MDAQQPYEIRIDANRAIGRYRWTVVLADGSVHEDKGRPGAKSERGARQRATEWLIGRGLVEAPATPAAPAAPVRPSGSAVKHGWSNAARRRGGQDHTRRLVESVLGVELPASGQPGACHYCGGRLEDGECWQCS